MYRLDLVERVFGRLTVNHKSHSIKGKVYWTCSCECGTSVCVPTAYLTTGDTKSCGCLAKETSRNQREDLVGIVFDRLTVQSFSHTSKRSGPYWVCLCSCGILKTVSGKSLRRGGSKSCGCLLTEFNKSRQTIRSEYMSEYNVFTGIKQRCNDPNSPCYHNYGGRGIKCLINNFQSFIDEVGPRPSGEYSLDRIDNDKHYEIGNIRWATRLEQQTNKRNTVMVVHKGENKSLAQLAHDNNLPSGVVWARIKKYGWSVEEALTTPILKRVRFHKIAELLSPG